MDNVRDELLCLARDCEPDSAAVLVAAAEEIGRLREALSRLTAACASSGVEYSDIVAARAALGVSP